MLFSPLNQAIFGDFRGKKQCKTGRDNGCIPWKIFQ